jgi:putative ABC transport system permease protein
VLVYTLDAVLLVITTATLVAIALLSVRERIRDYGVLKAMGLTPRQIASSVVGAHAAVALVAAVLSIPVGIGVYVAVYGIAGGSAEERVIAPWWWLALVPIGIVLMVVAARASRPASRRASPPPTPSATNERLRARTPQATNLTAGLGVTPPTAAFLLPTKGAP